MQVIKIQKWGELKLLGNIVFRSQFDRESLVDVGGMVITGRRVGRRGKEEVIFWEETEEDEIEEEEEDDVDMRCFF